MADIGVLPSLVGQFVIVITQNNTIIIGCLNSFNCCSICVLVWNGRRFVTKRIGLGRVVNIIKFPCTLPASKFVVIKLTNRRTIIGCQTTTPPNGTTIIVTVFAEGNNFSTLTIEKNLVGNIIVFPCGETKPHCNCC